MAYVVTGRCVDCRYTDCVEVCPVDCFWEIDDPAMLVIDPDTCIDCGACVPVCPIQAIYPEDEVPSYYQEYIELNAEKFEDGKNVTENIGPLEGAKDLAEIKAAEASAGHPNIADP
jgi:ferredoxin